MALALVVPLFLISGSCGFVAPPVEECQLGASPRRFATLHLGGEAGSAANQPKNGVYLVGGSPHDSSKKESHETHNGNGHTSTVETTTFLFDRRLMLERDGLVPDVLDKIPERELFVSYYSTWVNFGNLVSSSAASSQPTVMYWKTEPDSYYTVIMTGPDCPSHTSHTDREYLHWMVTNIKQTQYTDGDVIAKYVGATPTYVTAAHRFLFVIFKQPGTDKMSFHDQPILDESPENPKRRKFSTRNFAKKHGLEAVASNYYWIDFSKPLPTFEPWFRTPGDLN